MKSILVWSLLLVTALAHANATSKLTFFQNANRASIATLHDKNYILNVTLQSAYVSYLQPKKSGQAGIVRLQDFLNLWNDKNNPYAMKASLAFINRKGEYVKTRIVVTNPSVTNNVLSYQIAALQNPLAPSALKYLTLVFDDLAFPLDE